MIQRVDIITQAGASIHKVGDGFGDNEIVEIKIAPLYFTGDPFDHYCGYDKKGRMAFSINCLCPCVVHYIDKNGGERE